MGRTDKLAEAFKECSGPFPYRDLKRLLEALGYADITKNAGSSRRFYNKGIDDLILCHEPHPGKEIHLYLVKQIRDQLKEKGLI
jgi:hypothetical protein